MVMTFCFKLIHYLNKMHRQTIICTADKEILLKYNLMTLVFISNKHKFQDSTTSSENYFKHLTYLILNHTRPILSYMTNSSN